MNAGNLQMHVSESKTPGLSRCDASRRGLASCTATNRTIAGAALIGFLIGGFGGETPTAVGTPIVISGLQGTGVNWSPTAATPDANWNVVALPAGFSGTQTPTYAAWIFSGQSTGTNVPGPWLGGGSNAGTNGNHWIGVRANNASSLFSSGTGQYDYYSMIYQTNFQASATGLADLSIWLAVDNRAKVYVGGTVTAAGDRPVITGGQQIGSEIWNVNPPDGTPRAFAILQRATGAANVAAGSNTLYVVVDDAISSTTGTTFAFTGLLATQVPLIWNTANDTWTSSTSSTPWTISATSNPTAFAFVDGDAVIFNNNNGVGGDVTLSGSLRPSSIEVSATTGTYNFIASDGNVLYGETGLSKSGGGTLILTGSQGFTGTTDVTGGALFVNGVLSSTTTTVSNALLGGSGTMNGAVQLAAGSTIAPGASLGTAGILAMNSLSGTGFTFAMGITGTGAGQYDQIVTTGNLDYSGGTLALNLTGTYADGSSWNLFDFATQSGTLAGISPIAADSVYNGLTWGLAATSANYYDAQYGSGIWLSGWSTSGQRFIFNQADGVLTVVPEPSTLVMAAGAIAGWALLRRRRRTARKADQSSTADARPS